MKKILGKYIISDPEVCHGKLTFTGTRIFVEDVLDMVAQGISWDYITTQWPGSITKEAISEAVKLGKESLLEQHHPEMV